MGKNWAERDQTNWIYSQKSGKSKLMNYRVNAKQGKQNKVKAKWMDHGLLFRIKDNISSDFAGVTTANRFQVLDLMEGETQCISD